MPWKGSYARAIIALSLVAAVPVATLAVPVVPGPSTASAAGARHASARGARATPDAADAPVAGLVDEAKIREVRVERMAQRRARQRARARRMAARLKKHFTWPVRGRITSRFGPRRSPITGASEHHGGTDIACARGSAIRAAKSGRVQLAGHLPIYGRTVVIKHERGWVTFQSHMRGLSVGAGQRVRQGQRIGSCGSSGWATGPHLHPELRRPSGRSIDPLQRLWPRKGKSHRRASTRSRSSASRSARARR